MKKWKMIYKKISILALLLLALAMPAFAYVNQTQMCDGTIPINQNCTFLTPTINCPSYNYTILNLTGSEVESGNLTLLNSSVYYFNFTKTNETGKYIIILCDGTTREVFVNEGVEGEIMLGILMIIPLVLGLMMLLGSFFLGEEHQVFKIFLFLFSFIPLIVGFHMGMLNLVHFYSFPAMENLVGTTVYWFGIVFSVVIIYFLIYLITKIVHAIAQKKNEDLYY